MCLINVYNELLFLKINIHTILVSKPISNLNVSQSICTIINVTLIKVFNYLLLSMLRLKNLPKTK